MGVNEMETEREVSEEVIDGEAVEPAKREVATTPSSPTDEEIANHNETHPSCRAWFKVCVQGKARQSGHRARPDEATEKMLVQVDYYCEPINYRTGKYFSEYNILPVALQNLPCLNK